jgi:hypothetical protein
LYLVSLRSHTSNVLCTFISLFVLIYIELLAYPGLLFARAYAVPSAMGDSQ